MSKQFKLLVLLSLGFYQLLSAQNIKNVDSLIQLYKAQKIDINKIELGSLIFQNLSFTDPERAYVYARESVTISKILQNGEGLGQAYNNLSFYFLNKDQLDSALYYKKAALHIADSLQNIRGILTVNMGMAVLYNKMNNFTVAKNYLYENIALYQNRDGIEQAKPDDFKYMGSTYHALGDINVREGQF